MNIVGTIPEQGQLVKVRQRRYVVANVSHNTLPPDIIRKGSFTRPLQNHHIVTLNSLDDETASEELQVIWEIEPGAEIIEKSSLPTPDGFDSPQRLDAFLNAVRWGAASSADMRALQSPFRSGVELEDYQLDPVARAIQMPRVNLLIADDVGLGKTIEAGLVAQELILRNRVRKILIICPAALQIQWRDQMRDKFGLEFRIIDSVLMKQLRRERGLHVNPWSHFPRLITSVDYLKQERLMRLFSETLPAEGESAYPRRFDLLIVDEAHNIAPSGRGKYATDSQRTLAIRRLAPHFEHKLFLTATPHNGYPESFTALLELLDNQRFARGVQPDRTQLHSIMIRRLKSDFKNWAGSSRFPPRELQPIEVSYSEGERKAHRLLQEYTHSRLDKAQDEVERYATEFTLKLLKKRIFSSPEAFALTLAQHKSSLENARRRGGVAARPAAGILRRQLEQVEEELDDDEALEEAASSALEAAAPLFRAPSPHEQTLLAEMEAWGEKARTKADQKAASLISWLHQNIRPGGKWTNERVIIFTEYRATQKWLVNLLAAEGFVANSRLMTLYGGMVSDERERIKAAFQADPTESPVRILLATDAASEGIDLQNYCSRLIHYEIPWNPNRMEQRNGRIDRHGQRADKVMIYHFASSSYRDYKADDLPIGDLDADLEFLMRAVRKVEAIREDLGKVGPVIAAQVEEAMLGQRRRLDTRAEEDKAAPLRSLLKLEQKIQRQVEILHEKLQDSRRELSLTPDNVRLVVETALKLAGQPPLREARLSHPHDPNKSITVYYLPQLTGSWAACREGLDHPYTNETRPVVFDHDSVKGRDDVVLAHLNHRLVAMSLRLMRAEVWSPESQRRLYRVTARIVPDAQLEYPAVVAHARLLVIGGDSQRLHEELLTAGGYIREGRFVRMKREDLERAINGATTEAVADKIQQEFRNLWPTLKEPLYRELESRVQSRMDNVEDGLRRLLGQRAEKEAQDIGKILTELRDTIMKELRPNQPQQLVMTGFTTAEKEQFDRNISALQSRVEQIPAEIEQEQSAIRRRFADPQPRLFPVAVTFLIPRKFTR